MAHAPPGEDDWALSGDLYTLEGKITGTATIAYAPQPQCLIASKDLKRLYYLTASLVAQW